MIHREMTIQNKTGLHARPAAAFAETAGNFASKIQVRTLSGGTAFVNAKSIVRVLTLSASRGSQVEITADGADEAAALDALCTLIERKFGEDE